MYILIEIKKGENVIMKNQFRLGNLFFRSKWLVGAVGAIYVFIHAFLIWQMSWLNSGEVSVYLAKSQFVGIFVFLICGFVTYEFVFMEKACDLDEVLFINRRVKRKFYRKKIFFAVFFSLICGVTVFLYDIYAVSCFMELTGAVIVRLALANILNVFLVGVVAVFFGAFLASFFERAIAYSLLILFTFLMSPVVKNICSMIPISAEYGIEVDVMRIIDLFSLAAPDVNWELDDVYLFPIEMCRWATVLFWCGVFLFFIFMKTKSVRRTSVNMVVCVAAAVIGFGGFIRMGQDSVVRLDNRLWGTIQRDYKYWTLHETKEKEADFDILSYQIDLKIRSRLEADVQMEITKNPESDTYEFTLYRGYKIKSITDGDGSTLSYERDGNYLEVQYPFDESSAEMTIIYEGNGGKYYSNYQGIALPGYFAWYPRAGYLKMWDTDNGVNVLTQSDTESSFDVKVDTLFPICLVSNLEETADQEYSGVSTGTTMIGGLMEELDSGEMTYYNSPLSGGVFAQNLNEIPEVLSNAEEILQVSFDCDLSSKKIICLPETLFRYVNSCQGEKFQVFPDCILVSGGDYYLPDEVLNYFIPDKQYADNLKELLLYYLEKGVDADPYNADTLKDEKPDYSRLKGLETEYMPDDNLNAGADYEQLFRYQMNRYGGEAVLRACYEYLCSDSTENQVEFLYNLELTEGETE